MSPKKGRLLERHSRAHELQRSERLGGSGGGGGGWAFSLVKNYKICASKMLFPAQRRGNPVHYRAPNYRRLIPRCQKGKNGWETTEKWQRIVPNRLVKQRKHYLSLAKEEFQKTGRILRWLPRVFTNNPSFLAYDAEGNLVTLSLRFGSRNSPLSLPVYKGSFITFQFLD